MGNLIDIITVQKLSSMWKLAALFIFFLGINSILECSANGDPAVDDEEDEFKALREDMEDLFETALDERMDEVMNELKAVRRRLDEVQAVCAGSPIPDETSVDDDVGDYDEDVDDDIEDDDVEESAEEESAEDN